MNRYEIDLERTHASEAREEAARNEVEGNRELLADCVSDYYSGDRVEVDGHDLLTEFTLSLAGAHHLLDVIMHGDDIPEKMFPALRELFKQSAIAAERKDAAIAEYVSILS
jgi:hypothetical protein